MTEAAVRSLPVSEREERPSEVWCADITCLPMGRGFHFPVVIMDRMTCRVLACPISNMSEADFCVQALTEAIHRFGPTEILKTDHGSPFTSFA